MNEKEDFILLQKTASELAAFGIFYKHIVYGFAAYYSDA
jgi:hypothetical protein